MALHQIREIPQLCNSVCAFAWFTWLVSLVTTSMSFVLHRRLLKRYRESRDLPKPLSAEKGLD